MERRLEGKTALVTGASSGIGWSTAVRLGREGAAVGVNHLSDADKGGTASAVHEAAKELGRMDVLVNNAGIGNERPFWRWGLRTGRRSSP